MKILHVTADTCTHHTGIGQAMLDHISALRERGVEQAVVCRLYSDILEPLRVSGIHVETFDYNKWNKWIARLMTRRKIRRMTESDTPDVILCWSEKPATFIPRNCGVPSLAWDVGFGKFDLKREAVCDYYLGVNSGNIENIKRQTGRPDCVFRAYAFGTLPEDTPLSREEFGIPEDKLVILMLAQMIYRKGVDILLRSAVNVDAFLLLAGDGSELGNYRDLARKLGIESRVCFAGWRNDRSALLELADILAVPSRDDSCPAVMPEAFYKGVPLVASNTEGLGEYIEHGVNGMLSGVGDVDGLEKNLRMVIEDDVLREKLIAGGKRTYEKKFSKEVVIDNFLNICKEIIRRGIVKPQ